MDFAQIKGLGTATIVLVRDSVIWISKSGANLIGTLATNSGFTNSTLWTTISPQIQTIGTYVGPIFSKIGTALMTGYGTGGLLSAFVVLSAVKLWKSTDKCSVGFIFHVLITIVAAALAVVAFTYAGGVIV